MPYSETATGRVLPLDVEFSIDGEQFSATWLRNTTEAEKTAKGISWKPAQGVPNYDQRFYWGAGQPKDLAQVKKAWLLSLKGIANALLAPSDYLVTKKAENGTAIPSDWSTWRTTIRTEHDSKESAINAKVNMEDFSDYVTSIEYHSWTDDPDVKAQKEAEAASASSGSSSSSSSSSDSSSSSSSSDSSSGDSGLG